MVRMRILGFHYSLWREMFCKSCFPCPSLLLSSASLSLPFQSCLCLCPGLTVQHCCLFLCLSFSLSSSGVLSHSHPHAIFSPSAFSSFSSLSLCQQGKCWMHRMGSFSAVRACSWCHSGIWLTAGIIIGKVVFSSCNRWNELTEVWESSEILGAKGKN